jgi:uncharacterized membrane protein
VKVNGKRVLRIIGIFAIWSVLIYAVSLSGFILLCKLSGHLDATADIAQISEIGLLALQMSIAGVFGGFFYGASTLYPNEVATLEVPKSISSKIVLSQWAGVTLGIVTVISGLWYAFLGLPPDAPNVNMTSVINGCSCLVFAYGIYRRSRICALLLLVSYLVGKISNGPTEINGVLIVSLVFLWIYIRGAWGTFQYHHWLKSPVAKDS